MPSGKTHDAITLLLAAPTFAAAWGATGSLALASVATAGMLFGGLMFGPDLDILSRQYTRWGPLRLLWWPNRGVRPAFFVFLFNCVLPTAYCLHAHCPLRVATSLCP